MLCVAERIDMSLQNQHDTENNIDATPDLGLSHVSDAQDFSNLDDDTGVELPPLTGFAALHLNPALLQAVAELGYTEPTAVQLQTIPNALAGGDWMVSSQTGSGKTAASVFGGGFFVGFKSCCSGRNRLLNLR